MTRFNSRTRMLQTTGAAVFAAAALVGLLPTAAQADRGDRTVLASVQNNSSVRLTQVTTSLPEGKWTKEPPSSIKENAKTRFGSMSTEDEGGTEATVTYRTKYGDVEFYWDHPWAADDDITCDAPDELNCDVYTSGSATVKASFTISNAF
ncbi:hypothetical protein [Actinoplanes sp. NPDC051851]|uniref:hypothetical protein n=1 Tax=Actinoplanes sp. NPDC051851 TaxID=3154753 RepID=UPI00341F0D03